MRVPVLPADQRGMTVLEVLQTMTLLAVGLLGLTSLTLGTIHGNSEASRLTSAAVAAQDKIEELRAAGFDQLAEGTDDIIFTGVPYARSWSVCSDCPIAGAKELAVTVSWGGAATDAVTMRTIVTR